MQGLGDGFALGLALGQDPAQHLACAVGDPAFREARQVFAGKTVVQYSHGFVGSRQQCLHVGTFEHQRIVGRAEYQRGMECRLVRGQVPGLRALDQHPPRLYHPPAEPAAQRQGAGQRGFGAVSGGRQVIAMNGKNQRIAVGLQTETKVGAFGDDPLITHQPLETLGQGAARHQRIADHMKGCRAHHPRHVQADRLVAGELDRQLPEAGHRILGKTCVGVIERGEIQAELLEHGTAIEPFQFECLDDP
ncbi:hypothetical protein D3C80_1246730 [compost metagenome]